MKVNDSKRTGDKAVIKLEMKNTFAEKTESARAVVFLLDDRGKVVGQMTRWVIGGGTNDRPSLLPNSAADDNFVVSTAKPFTTTKVTFNRLVLEGGKLGDATKDIAITPASK